MIILALIQVLIKIINPTDIYLYNWQQDLTTMLAHPSVSQNDRFIPQRNYNQNFHLDSPVHTESYGSGSFYNRMIKKQLFDNINPKINGFNQYSISESEVYSESESTYCKGINPHVASPAKILSVPGIRDDFYLNTLDWSSRGPLVAALKNQIFVYTPQNLHEVTRFHESTIISSLKMYDCILAAGLSCGSIEIFDLEKSKNIRTIYSHSERTSALTFIDELLISGSKDTSIMVHDLRLQRPVVKIFQGHKGQICSLKTKNTNEKIFASGSGDGSAIIWDLKYGKIDQFKGHKGAVKALDWCPWRSGFLATGGGKDHEKYIKIWNTNTSKLVTSEKIDSQISSLIWNEDLKMLASSHGYMNNEISFWTLDCDRSARCRLVNQKNINAHHMRVLNMAQSHDGSYLCTIGADQNMKFWRLRTFNEDPFREMNCNDSRESQLERQMHRV